MLSQNFGVGNRKNSGFTSPMWNLRGEVPALPLTYGHARLPGLIAHDSQAHSRRGMRLPGLTARARAATQRDSVTDAHGGGACGHQGSLHGHVMRGSWDGARPQGRGRLWGGCGAGCGKTMVLLGTRAGLARGTKGRVRVPAAVRAVKKGAWQPGEDRGGGHVGERRDSIYSGWGRKKIV
jgi:hypothetical protein